MNVSYKRTNKCHIQSLAALALWSHGMPSPVASKELTCMERIDLISKVHPILKVGSVEEVRTKTFTAETLKKMNAPKINDFLTRYYAAVPEREEIEIEFAKELGKMLVNKNQKQITDLLGEPQAITGDKDQVLGLLQPGPHWLYQIGYARETLCLSFELEKCTNFECFGLGFTKGYLKSRLDAMKSQTIGLSKKEIIAQYGPEVKLADNKDDEFSIPINGKCYIVFHMRDSMCEKTSFCILMGN